MRKTEIRKTRLPKNSIHHVTAQDLSDQGYGVAHVDGKTVFVRDLLPGEEADIRIIRDLATHAIAIVDRRMSNSPDRSAPFCPRNGVCGGCSMWNLKREAEIEHLQKDLEKLFRQADPDVEVLPILEDPDSFWYRNKAQFPVAVRDGKIVSGFYRGHSHDIVDTESCAIQDRMINEIYAWIRSHMSLEQAEGLRHIFIRWARKNRQGQVVFIGEKNNGLESLAEKLREAFPQVTSIVFNHNDRKDNVILGDTWEVLHGSDSIMETCMDLDIRLHFKSFFQVNPEQMERLYAKALELAGLQGDEEVIDLYSGTGTIGLLASKKAGHVTGVEIVREAVENARENARINGIENVDFVCEDAAEYARKNHRKVDVLFVDPPRKGLDGSSIEHIAAFDPERLVYVSCNPRTLARDIKRLRETGYRVQVIQPVDMFAHTGNSENVALFVREENAAGKHDCPEQEKNEE